MPRSSAASDRSESVRRLHGPFAAQGGARAVNPTVASLLDLLSLEDIPDAAERIAAFRAKVRELPEPERARL